MSSPTILSSLRQHNVVQRKVPLSICRANCGINVTPCSTDKICRVPKKCSLMMASVGENVKAAGPGNVGSPDLAPIPIQECHTTHLEEAL
ncbi:hypothetical protein PoB_004157400 [Plakobranchus ocellatus]|uniref:Uncharacterized protein n=1 Tax=Plakobranchus ocellatus TaxID=259542 RepID=A0AAV4B8Q4_9GAST|nr:hypothetical protein PoB_004157400 [Plakobranchus ocellatus]